MRAFQFRFTFSNLNHRKQHHRKKTFKEELRGLLRSHRVEFDERYLWDCPLHRPYRAPFIRTVVVLGLTPQAISHHPFGVLEPHPLISMCHGP
jgi:hypothetical protein